MDGGASAVKIDRPSVGCVGASILKPLKLDDWVVEDRWRTRDGRCPCGNLKELVNLRSTLRQRLEKAYY